MNNKRIYRREIKCIETGKTFSCVAEASNEMNLHRQNLYAMLKGKRNHVSGYHFVYTDAPEVNETATETNDAPKEILIAPKAIIKGKGKRANGNTNAVICMTTGEVFTSCSDAADHIGTSNGHMSMVCRGKGKSAKGRKFCYVKDIDEHLGEVVDCIRKANMYDEVMTNEEKRKELIATIQHHKETIVMLEEQLIKTHELLADAEREMHDFMYR